MKEIDFNKSEVHPKLGYVRVVYKDKSELHEPVDKDAIKVINYRPAPTRRKI